MSKQLTLSVLEEAVRGTAAAFRCVTEYQPAGGEGDKIFPPTYEGGKYAVESRLDPGTGEPMQCVLVDSVQSQANRMELALLEAWEEDRIPLPVLSVDFAGNDLPRPLRVTSLEAPHRIADALLRDSLLAGVPFRRSPEGQRLDHVDLKNATALLELCPTALVFGMWDSTGPRGGLGAKFPRALVSEIVGYRAVQGEKTSSRIDPAQIVASIDVYEAKASADGLDWTLDTAKAATDGKKPRRFKKKGKPSEANHGNVTPTVAHGGFTIQKAVQTTVISLAALRRLRFPIGDTRKTEADAAARTALAALGLCAATLAREQGADLRSRCLLVPTMPFVWELLDQPGAEPKRFDLPPQTAVELLQAAVKKVSKAGLPWRTEELRLVPHPELVEMVRRSQAILSRSAEAEEEAV